MEDTLAVLEQPNEVEVFQLKRAKAKAVEEVMQHWLDEKKLGSIVADESTNQIVVQALPGRMKEVLPLIEKLDKEAVVEDEASFLGTLLRLLVLVVLVLIIAILGFALAKAKRARAL